MIVCTKCSTENADGDEFCGGCGEFLEWAGQKVTAEPEPEPAPDPTAPEAVVIAPEPLQPEPVQPEPVQPEPAQPAAVLPSKPVPQRAEPVPAAAAEPALRPGEFPCPSCGAGNEPERSFCRRCGSSLAAPPEEGKKPSWWKKLVTKDPKVHAAGDRPMRDKKGKFKP